MIAASLCGVTIDPEQSEYYRGLGEDLFSRWEDVTGEDYRSVDMGIKRTDYREDRYRKGALRALEHAPSSRRSTTRSTSRCARPRVPSSPTTVR